MGVHQLPVSPHQRPKLLSRAQAEREVVQAAASEPLDEDITLTVSERAEHFFGLHQKCDQIWLFETSGYGVKQIKGLALERKGQVIQILILTGRGMPLRRAS